jgi:predicted metal-dependent peptidase
MNQEIVTKLTRARATLILDQPFFGALALRLALIEDPSTKTLCVDGKHIYYNPTFVGTLSADLTKAIIAHEVMHCVLDHMSRLGERNHKQWNQAADYAINQLLEDVGFSFEGTGLLNPAFKDMSADHIYSLLPPPDPDTGDNGIGDPLDDMQSGSPDPAAKAEATREWKVATIQAANAAKIMGKLPGSLERFIDQMFKAQVDWRAVLRQFVHETTKNDYAWTKPNKHMLVHGVYMPSLHSENMGDIVVGIDVSGSIDKPTLDAFSAEISAIVAETMPANVHLVYCDSRVAGTQSFARHEEVDMKPVGGGGTEFKPVFDWVEEHGIQPVCLVYLTDLYGDATFAPPPYPTLWCCTNEQVAPFGDTVHIEV